MNQRPSAPLTDGLSSADRDRAASMADEGGTSAANVEASEGGASAANVEAADAPPVAVPRETRFHPGLFVLLAAAAVALLVVVLARRT
jgi:hypothetical protein